MNYKKHDRVHYEKIKKLYSDGFSAYEIVNILKLSINPRTIQRWLKNDNLIRSKSDSFRLAVNRGRVKYHKKPDKQKNKRITINFKLRYRILSKYSFRCVLCGNTAKESRIQVDHINNNPSDNSEDNLQALCEMCNKGKYLNN